MEIQTESESFSKYAQLNSWEATKGLFSYIESKLSDDWSHWDYVPNAQGGFMGMWFHFTPCASTEKCEIYLQIENYCTNKINLFIKICGEWERTVDDLYYIFGIIKEKAEQFNLHISKPSRYRVGEYTSVAIIDEVFIENSNADLDLSNCINKIKSAISLVDTVAEMI